MIYLWVDVGGRLLNVSESNVENVGDDVLRNSNSLSAKVRLPMSMLDILKRAFFENYCHHSIQNRYKTQKRVTIYD